MNNRYHLIYMFLLLITGFTYAQNKTENVILITLDGMRWQEVFTGADSILINSKEYVEDMQVLKERFWKPTAMERRQTLMPFLWSVVEKNGAIYGNRKMDSYVNCSNTMWFSYPGYNEILSGYADDARITSNDKINNPNTTVLEFLNSQSKFKGSVAAFGSWDVFPFIINELRSGIPVNAGFEPATGSNLTTRERFLNQLQNQIPSPWGSVRLDAFTHHYAMEYMKKNKPKVVYIAYGETDDFAHNGKYDSYLKSAWQTDQFIKAIWDWVQSDSHYRNRTTLLITTDHGRGVLDAWRDHGSKVQGANEIWFAALGAGVTAKGEVKGSEQLYQNQVAGTLAALLGFKFSQDGKAGAPIRLTK